MSPLRNAPPYHTQLAQEDQWAREDAEQAIRDRMPREEACRNALKVWLGTGRTATVSDADINSLFETMRRLGAQL